MRSNSSKKNGRGRMSAMAIGALAALFTLVAPNRADADGDLAQRRAHIRPPALQTPSTPSLDPREVMVPIDPPRPVAPGRQRDPVRQSPASDDGASAVRMHEPGTSWVHRLLARLCGGLGE